MKGVRSDPPRAEVIRIVGEEATAFCVSITEVIGRGRRPQSVDARRRAIQRIVDETACSFAGLGRVWGVDEQTISKYANTFQPPAPYDSATFERLSFAHGGAQAERIVRGEDRETLADQAAWRNLGRGASK